ncbi:Zygote-specific protein [Balamuthia mandrillaris]
MRLKAVQTKDRTKSDHAMKTLAVLFMTLIFTGLIVRSAEAGPVAYGVCQAGCSALVVKCYAAAGVVFGTITAGAGTPAVILGCNAAFGLCSANCAIVALTAPTP